MMARSESPSGTFTTRTGPVLAVIPRSNSHTSPLRACILFPMGVTEQGTSRHADFFVFERARVERQIARAPQNLDRNGLLVFRRQRLEGIKKACRSLAHIFRLRRFQPTGKLFFPPNAY